MRRFAVHLAVIAVLWTTPAAANEPAVRQVIGDQIAAFEADDFAAAFEFASPAIRSIFGTPERFGAMVQQGYPMVHRPDTLRFLEARDGTRGIVQRVLITDGAGRVHLLEYEMIDLDGRYLINGVRLLRGAEAGA
ncbi:DUF4864 domain-containing protein [Pararhodobacter sp. SW119]|uniref:DUF4864 domain-containing protein n=1 Tax=Pararhodobacter sp. SW119 TaxID=2780075 RepID=UPI001ADEC682|nr:DUF4864 domain-containing protein [Pararhodobacter sp. SW119]